MTALKWITTEAKRLKKQYPKRFATWKEYVSQASAIYATKHKGKSPVGKKRSTPKKVAAVKTTSKSHTDKNRITANIQVGTIAGIKSKGLQLLKEKYGKLAAEKACAVKKMDKRKYQKEMSETLRKIRTMQKM